MLPMKVDRDATQNKIVHFTVAFQSSYTLSHLENDRDVSAHSGGRRWSSRAQLVGFFHAFKKEHRD